MLFYSTNQYLSNGFKEKVDFITALFKGQAPDEGLFMPDKIPYFSSQEINRLKNEPYWKVAGKILFPFLSDVISEEELMEITSGAYNFDIPIDKVSDKLFLARMDAGPTSSFKDFAAQLMARLMKKFKPPNEEIKILVATSGDTGSAIGEAFKGLDGIKVYILFPKNEVSTIQRKQLITVGQNVTAIEIDGKFDDCQQFVKQAFTDPDLKELNLTSANSINIGRLLPQIVYYFYIYLKISDDFEPVNFCIPTGNLGNAMGCELARQMGLPVDNIIVATNSNNSIPNWLLTKTYNKISPSKNCISNAMNVGNPSNLARLFDLYGGSVDKDGNVYRQPYLEKIKQHFKGVWVSDEETIAYMKNIYKNKNLLVEQHGAVGLVGIEKYFNSNDEENIYKTVVLETAHPAKFPEVIEKELGISPQIPPSLQQFLTKKEESIKIKVDYQEFKKVLFEN